MKKHIFFLSFIALLFGCSDDEPTTGTGGGQTIQATYRITFIPDFTEADFPTDYPTNPMFVKMIVVAHGTGTTIFREGLVASPGFEEYAEEGTSSTLETEHESVEDGVNPTTFVFGSADVAPLQTSIVNINVTPTTTRLSFVSRISPSPDWFVGLDSYNLVNPDNSLVDEVELILSFYDAGTDAGTTYTAADEEENSTISVITGAPFQNPDTGLTGRLGTLKIERIDNGIE